MNSIRRHAKPLAFCLSAMVLLTAAAVLGSADNEDLLQQAQAQYERHNYKTVVTLADKVLAASPPESLLRAAQRLRALGLCRQRNAVGYDYAEKIMSEHAPFKEDAELWMAMGADQENHWPRKKSFDAYKKAGELFEKDEKHDTAAEAFLKAVEMLRNDYGILPQPAAQQKEKKPWTWQDQRLQSLQEIIRLCEHVATLKVSDETKTRALYIAAQQACSQGEWNLAEMGIALYRRIVKEFPKTPQAPNAQLETGGAFQQFNRFVEALAEYRLVVESWPEHALAKVAKQRIAEIKAPRAALWVTKSFLPGEKAEVYWLIRNIRKLSLTATAVDLPAAVEKVQTISDLVGVLSAQQGQVKAEWTFDTPDDGKHQFHQCAPQGEEEKQTTVPIEVPLKERGAYLIKAVGANPDGQSDTAYCLVVISKIAAVAKLDADQVVVFANDVLDGTPCAGASVAAVRYWGRNGRDHASGKIDDAGLAELKMPRRNSCQWLAAVRAGDDQALCAQAHYSWWWWGYREQYKVYGFTDRPVYRPKDVVHFKQVVRACKEGDYANLPAQKVQVQIQNPKGETIYSRDHVTDEFGAIEGELPTQADWPLGVYSIQVHVGGMQIGQWHVPGNRFRLEEYRKPEFKVTVEPGRPDYRVGDEMKIKIGARYYYGQPVSGAEVRFTIRKQSYTHRYEWPRPFAWYYEEIYYSRQYGRWRPWWRPQFDELVAQGTAKTDSAGEAFVTVKADAIKGHEELDLKFVVEAEVTDASRRVIRGAGEVKVTHTPFYIYPKPAQWVYGPGDSVEINVKTENPSGQPVAGEFTVEAWRIERIRKVVRKDGREVVEFEEKLAQKLHAGPLKIGATGRGAFRFTPDVTGNVKIIVRETLPANRDAARQPVEGSCELWIASKTGAEAHYAYNDLQVVPAADQYEVGQTMKLLVNTRFENSRVLLTGEADGLLFVRVVHVKAKSALVEIPVEAKLSPNFRLTATLLRDGRLLMDTKEMIVPPTHRFLKVVATLDKGDLGGGEDNKYQPREKTRIRLRVSDLRTGEPVRGQVALILVDSSVYYIQPEFREEIEKAFYGATRHVMVSTADSFAGPASIAERREHLSWGRPGLRMAEAQAADGMGRAMPMAALAPRESMKGAMADKAEELEGAPQLAETIIRENFRDTVLWAGAVTTDADGTASVPVEMPDQLTTFALHAIALDKDTRVGQTQSDVVTTKRIIVRLQGGRFFTEGDHAYVTVIAHNYYDDAQKLQVDLAADAGLKLRQVKLAGKWQPYVSGQALDVTVPPGGEVRLDFQTTAERPGEVKLLARARGVKESDAIQLTKPIVPWGAVKLLASGGILQGAGGAEQGAEWTFEIPREIGAGSQELIVTLNPTVAAAAMESLPYLAAYPYGCVEQTMSRFLPTMLMRKTLQDAGVDLDTIRKRIEQQAAQDPKLAARYKHRLERWNRNPVYSKAEVDAMIAAGLKRLADMQHGDGGWGWWKQGSSDPYMTAYVVSGLVIARDCDADVPAGMIERGAKFLAARAATPKVDDRQDWWYRHIDNDNTRAYVLYALGRADAKQLRQAKIAAELKRLFDARDELSDCGRAMLAMALRAAGKGNEATVVVENLENTAILDEKLGTAHWGQIDGWWYWYHGATETTSWVLQAMLDVRPDDKHVPMAVNWLVANRREGYWHNTKTTAMAVYALARYAKVAGELDCDQTFEVTFGGVTRTVHVTRENVFTAEDRVVIPAGQLPPGKHAVKVVRKGKGNLYWGAYAKFFTKEDPIRGGGNRMAIARNYWRLVPEKFENTRQVWKDGQWVTEKFPDLRYQREKLPDGAEVASGDLVEAELTIQVDENVEYMLFEDPKPSGCEPYDLVSGGSYAGGTYANMELRDTKVVFFASCLGKGEHKIAYKLVCEQPGTFQIIPTSGEAMYSPFIQAISDSGKLTITEKP